MRPVILFFIAAIFTTGAGCVYGKNSQYCDESNRCDEGVCDFDGVRGVRNRCVDSLDGGVPAPTCTIDNPTCDDGLHCDLAIGLCGECSDEAPCGADPNGPVCLPGVEGVTPRACGCKEHRECGSKVCGDDARCVAAENIIYVSKGGSDLEDCGSTDPHCLTVQFGIQRAKQATAEYVHVLAAENSYGEALAIAGQTVRLIGDGRPTIDPPEPGDNGITIAGSTTNVVIDGFTVIRADPVTGIGGNGIDCRQAKVSIRRSLIRDNLGIGINAIQGCDLTVDRSEIGNSVGEGNDGGGIHISDGTYRLTNNIIANNGKADPGGSRFGGIHIENDASGSLEFNTITGNIMKPLGLPGGVQCFGATSPAANNLVQGNGPEAKQVQGICDWKHSALDAASVIEHPDKNNISDACALDGMNRLVGPANACKDKGTATVPEVRVDIDGNSRPFGTGAPDIGAHELQE